MPFRLAHFLVIVVAAVVLVGLRLYLLPDNGMPDYDTLANWQVARELAGGDFRQLFHHRAPFFNLFYAGLSLLTSELRHLIAVNALLNVLAVVLMCRLVLQRLQARPMLWGLLLLAAGLCVFMVHSSRYLTIESASLPVFALLLRASVLRCEHGQVRHWYQSLAWLAVGISINYKMVLVLPVLLLLELLSPRPFLAGRQLLYSMGLLLAPVLIWVFAGIMAGLPWYKYLASYAGIARFDVPNAAFRTGKFQSDLSFYFRYLLAFESPLAWLGLLLYPMVYRPWQFIRKKPLQLPDVLAVFCFAFVLGMSLLLKAPRGLAFVYVPMYLLGFLCVLQLARHRMLVVHALLAASSAWSVWLCERHVFRYSASGYAQMAAELQKRKVKQVVQVGGNGLHFFQEKAGLRVMPVVRHEELENARQHGAKWLVLDNYYKVLRLPDFDVLANAPAEVSVASAAHLSPLFFLEHAEFTGLGYRQTMQLRQQAIRDPAQLRLIRLR